MGDYASARKDYRGNLEPLFPLTAFVPVSVCPHGKKMRQGSKLCCMVCHKSGKDKQIGGKGTARETETEFNQSRRLSDSDIRKIDLWSTREDVEKWIRAVDQSGLNVKEITTKSSHVAPIDGRSHEGYSQIEIAWLVLKGGKLESEDAETRRDAWKILVEQATPLQQAAKFKPRLKGSKKP